MSEKRETILRLLQDETGRILDVKVEQQPAPEPKYVFDVAHKESSSNHRTDGSEKFSVFLDIVSYKTFDDDKTVIPVPFTANGETVVPTGNGIGFFQTEFDSDTMEEDPENPYQYKFAIHFVQNESGKTFPDFSGTLQALPSLKIQGKPSMMSYAGGEQTFDIVLKHARYEDIVVSYISEEVSKWLHASVVGKQLYVTCEKTPTPNIRSGSISLRATTANGSSTSNPILIAQEASK